MERNTEAIGRGKEKPRPGLVNVFELTEKQREEFQRRLEVAKGRIFVFIHPYWTLVDHENPEEKRGRGELVTRDTNYAPGRLQKMQRALEKLLVVQRDGAPPIVVFEDQRPHMMEGLSKRITKTLVRDAYIVPTLPGEEWGAEPPGGWATLNDLLKELGVSEVVMAGMSLEIDKIGDEEVYGDIDKWGGCVRSAVGGLSEKFKVTMSKLTFPSVVDIYDHGAEPEHGKTSKVEP